MSTSLPTTSSALQIGLGAETQPGVLPKTSLSGLTVRAEQFQAHASVQRSRWLEQTILPRFPVRINSHVSSRLTLDVSPQPACLSLLSAALAGKWKSGWPKLAADISPSIIEAGRRTSALATQIGTETNSLSLTRGFAQHTHGMHYAGMRAVETRLRLSQDSLLSMQMYLLGIQRKPLTSPTAPKQDILQPFSPAFKPFYLALRWADETKDAPLYLTEMEMMIRFQTARPLFRIGVEQPAAITPGKPQISGRLQFIHRQEDGFSWSDQNRKARLQLVMRNAGGHILGCELPAIRLIEEQQQTALNHAPVLMSFRFEVIAEAGAVAPMTLFYLPPAKI